MIAHDAVLSFASELVAPHRLTFRVDPGLAPDGYRFEFADGVLEVSGENARGALYAAYDFLEGAVRGSDAPRFTIRGVNPCESLARHSPEQLRKFIDRLGRWRFNRIVIHTQYGYEEHRELLEIECARRGIEPIHYTYYNLAFCGDVSPEYFARKADGGVKASGRRLECYDRLCASNPEGLAAYGRGVDAYLRTHPELDEILFATADGAEYCECARCRHLGPVEQCMAFYDPFFDCAGGRKRHFISYFHRYHLPVDLRRLQQTEFIMFDTHVRDRRVPLRDEYARSAVQPRLIEADPRASMPVNRYLIDRLKEWREVASGKVYVFENYMMQSIYGVPTLDNHIYLQDLRLFAELGIDGVVYEAFEPGIQAMLPLLDAAAQALWHPERDYEIDQSNGVYRPDYQEFYRLAGEHKANRNWTTWAALLEHLLSRPDYEEFDFRYIGFNAAWFVQQRLGAWRTGDEWTDRFLSINKLWDFMNEVERPRETTERIIRELLERVHIAKKNGC